MNQENIELFNTAAACFRDGKLDAAEECYRQILICSIDNPRAVQGLGVVLFQKGLRTEGIDLLRSVLALQPDFASAWLNLGNMLVLTGYSEDALTIFSQAALFNSDSSMAHYNLGRFHYDHKDFADAVTCFEKALLLQQDYLDAALLLGVAYAELGDLPNAIRIYEGIAERNPVLARVWCNLGYWWFESGELHLAQQALAKALRCDAGIPETWNSVGNLSLAVGKTSAAIRAFKTALELDPLFITAHSNLLLAMHYLEGHSPDKILKESIAWNSMHGMDCGDVTATQDVSHVPGQPLRVGIVSADFRSHPVAMFLEPFLLEYDRTKLEIFCYADVVRPDEVTGRMAELADRWISIVGMNSQEVCERIKSDGIQVLFDVGGHTNAHLLRVFSGKPAPVQVAWLGYPGTTGLSAIDFRLGDDISDPCGLTQADYTEKLIRLPGNFLCYVPPTDAPPIESGERAPRAPVVFGCFNNFAKINTAVLKTWITVLKAVPGAKLLLKNRSLNDVHFRSSLKKRYALLGGSCSDLILMGQTSSFTEHLNTYNMVDVALDTFPYNGTTTTCEALLMGVPVITLSGRMHVGRVSASILSSMNCSSWVASTRDEYISLAVRVANRDQELFFTRDQVRSRFVTSALCDARMFARNMEMMIHQMWGGVSSAAGAPEDNTRFIEMHAAGLDCLSSKNYVKAENYFRRSLSQRDTTAEAWSDLGISVFHQGRKHESLEYFQRAIGLAPDYARGWSNLGNALRECGRAEEAVDACRKALALQPALPEARTNLGVSLMSLGRHKEAFRNLLEATRLDENSPLVWTNAGDTAHELGMPYQARACYRRVIRLDSGNAAAHAKLGAVLLGMFEHDQAAIWLRKALNLSKDDADVHSAILMSFQYVLSIPQQTVYEESLRWKHNYGVGLPWGIPIKPKENLRIGFVSADFRRHPVGIFLLPLLSHLDRNIFSIFLYSNDFREDPLTAQLQRICDGWRMIAGQNDREAAEVILHDGIDILIDLSGHTAGNRLPLFARKPAPVQASFLGYSHTTGMDAMDYILSDEDTIVPGEEKFYSEQVLRLSGSRFCYQAPDFVPDVSDAPANENGSVTFGSFNNLAKVSEEVVALWAKVLQAVPDSRLILKWKSLASGHVRQKLFRLFSRHGVDKTRIELRESSPHFLMMAEYADIDIALDPYPFSGGLTTCEALWMGVPVISLAGTTPIGRQSVSFLRQVGLDDFIAQSVEEYIQIAIEKSANIGALAESRRLLRQRMASSSLCDGKRYAKNVESALLQMWNERLGSSNSDDAAAAQYCAAFEAAARFFHDGFFERSKQLYLDILRWQPENTRALNGLGMVVSKQGFKDEGIALLQKAIAINPDYTDAHIHLGNMFKGLDRFSDAEDSFRNALRLNPDNSIVKTLLAGNLWSQGRIEEAIRYFQSALEQSPELVDARTGLLLSMNYSHTVTPEEICEVHLRWGNYLESLTPAYKRWYNVKDPRKVIRVGYVSSDLGIHPVGFFMVKPIQYCNASEIQVFCYSTRTVHDELTDFIKSKVAKWTDIKDFDDNDVCKMIRKDRIDILVDLSGHTGGNRLSIFARQPAPVQVTWLGYPNTTGLRRIQYRLTDAIVDPPGASDRLHSEELFRLPHGFLCYYPSVEAPEVSPLPYARNGFVTYGSFNNLAKITPEVLTVWSRIMAQTPHSRLVIKRSAFHDEKTVQRFQEIFSQQGIDSDRIQLVPATETHTKHLEIYSSIDISLDTFPYNGTTTTCEALWMGVPVVVLAGERHAGRVGMSILDRVGLDELIAGDSEDFIAIAVNLSRDIGRLAEMRASLREKMYTSPLCDGPGFSADLQHAYREMWTKYCVQHLGKSPKHLPQVVRT